MPDSIGRRLLLVVMIAGVFQIVAVAEDAVSSPTSPTESSWASFRNGPAQRGIAGTTLSQNPQVKWEITSKDGWVATCAIVGDHVYAPALQGHLYCLESRNRKRNLEVSIDRKSGRKGIRSRFQSGSPGDCGRGLHRG